MEDRIKGAPRSILLTIMALRTKLPFYRLVHRGRAPRKCLSLFPVPESSLTTKRTQACSRPRTHSSFSLFLSIRTDIPDHLAHSVDESSVSRARLRSLLLSCASIQRFSTLSTHAVRLRIPPVSPSKPHGRVWTRGLERTACRGEEGGEPKWEVS